MRSISSKSLILALSLFTVSNTRAQIASHDVRIGFGFLMGKQMIFPFNDLNYNHNQKGYRLKFNYLLRSGKFSYELQIEPSIYKAWHRMLNPFYILPSDGTDYLSKRELYMQKRTITDCALNIGFLTRYSLSDSWSSYFLFSTGPSYIDRTTERQAKGFAFSNVLSLGMAYNTGRLRFELGPGIRHVSNANTHFPNGGYNSSTIDFGITCSLKK